MASRLRINVFLGDQFLFSSSGSGGKEIILDGARLDIGPHIGLFDIDYVRKVTKEDRVDAALTSFLSIDKFFGCDCNYLFDSESYVQNHGTYSGMHPVVHYILVGDHEGARTGEHFWTDWVRSRYPGDSRTALQIHMEGQNWVAPNPYFDPIWYLNLYPDVFRAGEPPFRHYLRWGQKEGRSPHRLVDWSWYESVLGRPKPEWSDYMRERWLTGLFPNPYARAGWAYLTDKEFEELFECNLSPVVGVPYRCPDDRYTLMNPPTPEALRSISPTFPHHQSREGLARLMSIYAKSAIAQSALVSVVLPTRNRLPKLKRAVDSVLSQTHRNVELLIVDDGSNDGTGEWVRGLHDDRVKLFERPPTGVSAARNAALDNATGDYVAFLDSDNAMVPEYLAAMLAHCVEARADLAYAGLRLYNDAGDVRYRFKEYDASTYWKSNYIDMNVVFHRRAPFPGVRFDEGLKRCVDWDYILKLCEVATPEAVPILGCDYYHDGAGIDRITLSGPVWDCFRVSQRHRPAVLKTEHASEAFIVPVLKRNADIVLALLSRELDFLPSTVRVQCVVPAALAKKKVAALRSLLLSAGQPDVLTCHMPEDEGALTDYGLAMSTVAADRWHITASRDDASLIALLSRANSLPDTTIAIPHCDGDGMYLALQYAGAAGRWERVLTNHAILTGTSVPLEFDLLNVRAQDIENLDLRCGGGMAMALFALKHQAGGGWAAYVEKGSEAAIRQDMPYSEGLRLLNMLREHEPLPVTDKRELETISVKYEVYGSVLETIRVRSEKQRALKFAIFTPAPNRMSGWGDEYYAESLAKGFVESGVPADVIYRKDWHGVGGEYSHVLHIRGIIKPELKDRSVNLIWIISHPDAVQPSELAGCDYILSASRQHAEDLAAEYGNKVVFLPQCTAFEPSPDIRSAPIEAAAQRCAVFVGDSKKVFRYPIDDLARTWPRLVLVGPNWEGMASMGQRYRRESVRNEDLPVVYRGFGAVLNQHWPDMARLGFVSNRLYDVAAAGGYFITDACNGIPPELLSFGAVWHGGSIEDIFLAKPSIPGRERYDKAVDFYAKNSFKARAAAILRLLE